MENILIKTIMTSKPFIVSASTGLNEASLLMSKNAVRHLIVTEGTKLVGILSKSDIEKFDFIKKMDDDNSQLSFLSAIKVDAVMTVGVHTLYEDETLKDAAEMLTLGAYHALPVVNFDGEVLGIVSTTDLMLHMLKNIKEN